MQVIRYVDRQHGTQLAPRFPTSRAPGLTPPRVHRVISNLKSWLQGTHRGVSGTQLQVYLDEFTFRFNRRRTPMAAFQTLLGLGSAQPPTTYRQITGGGRNIISDPADLTG
jgi:ISXO2 transposase-like protein